MMNKAIKATLLSSALVLSACGGDSSTNSNDAFDFSLNFKAVNNGVDVDCDTMLTGFGPEGADSIGVQDLRFYISNVQFYNDAGEALEVTLNSNDFQYNSDQGFVALIDLTSNESGYCADGEGTARTNTVITGTVNDSNIADVSFDIGLPQSIMKNVIATSSEEDAPSPLNEMYWNWAAGYRHFVFNFDVMDGVGTMGDGLLHIGSRSCGGDGLLALEEKEECDFINTPTIMLENFDPDANIVTVDLGAALSNVDFTVSMQETTSPGVACHSNPMQADCAVIFTNFGLEIETGAANTSNAVFGME